MQVSFRELVQETLAETRTPRSFAEAFLQIVDSKKSLGYYSGILATRKTNVENLPVLENWFLILGTCRAIFERKVFDEAWALESLATDGFFVSHTERCPDCESRMFLLKDGDCYWDANSVIGRQTCLENPWNQKILSM